MVVQDSVRCGTEMAQTVVKDATKCGTTWCNSRATFNVCPKSCTVSAERAKSCRIVLACPVRITMHIKGSAPTTSIGGMQFQATLIDYKVYQKSAEIQATLDANKPIIKPWLQDGMNLGMKISNTLAASQMLDFEHSLVNAMEHKAVQKYKWIARVLVGSGDGFVEGVAAAMQKRFSKVGLEMFTRSEVAVSSEGASGEKLCHRLLRITPSDGVTKPYHIKDWRNALIARKYDNHTDCNSAYVAHCGTGTLVKNKTCPMQAPVVTKSCLFSTFCWRGSRHIHANSNKEARLFIGHEEVVTHADIKIDHVAANAVRHNLPFAQEVVAAASTQEQAADKLDTLVQIRDEELPRTLRDEVCKRVKAKAWYGFKNLKSLRCRLALRGVLGLGSWSDKFAVSGTPIPYDVDVEGGAFKVNLIPDWELFAHLAEVSLLERLKDEKFPMDSKLEALNLKMDGDKQVVEFEVKPSLTGMISAAELEELGHRFADNQDMLPPVR